MGGEIVIQWLLHGAAAGVALAIVYAVLSKAKWLSRTLIASAIFVASSVIYPGARLIYLHLVTANDPQPIADQLHPAQRP